jgi:hypothetical protein
MGSPGGAEEATRTTELALKLGYRHIDTVRSKHYFSSRIYSGS